MDFNRNYNKDYLDKSRQSLDSVVGDDTSKNKRQHQTKIHHRPSAVTFHNSLVIHYHDDAKDHQWQNEHI